MTNPDLLAHNRTQFEKSVVALAPGMWSAIGYAASNVHMIEGRNSVTIIDTTESTAAADAILSAFRGITDKPVGRIIYTHSHRDHISGAQVFSDGTVPIYASSKFSSDLIDVDPEAIAPNRALGRRTQAQFGIGLTSDERVSLGCGPGDRPMKGLGAGFLPPTDLQDGDCDIDLDGVAARLIHAPGETADHLVVWVPAARVLVSGDNWYHAFPNLYAIRGTPYRDFAAWARTLGNLAALRPLVLAPGHTMPVHGEEAVQDVLTSTQEAILHVMRHASEGMDAGLSLDDIAASITLPEALRDKPWLKEFYGKASWSAKAFAVGSLGWYDGNPTHLGTLSSHTRAQKMADLAGGTDALLRAAEETDNLQWRLELCDHLIALGLPVEALKAAALRRLAETEINATARNTYLWEARRLEEQA